MLSVLVEFHFGKRCKIGSGEGEEKSEKEGNANERFSFFSFAKFFFAARLIRGVKNGTVFLQEVALSRKEWGKKSWTYPRSSAITTLVI